MSCEACGKIHALTALEMVRDTSERMGNPAAAMTLTTKDPDRVLGRVWCKDVEAVIRSLRRRWPSIEYLGFMEWTEGGAKSRDGRRRPHMHLLLRGLPVEHAAEADQLARRVWLARTGAHRVEVAPLRAAENGAAYLALHHLKPAQHAPEGWSGRRLRPSQGWWGVQDAQLLRRAAQESVRDRAHRHRALEERKRDYRELVEDGCPEELARDLVLGPEGDLGDLPPRSTGATIVRLRSIA